MRALALLLALAAAAPGGEVTIKLERDLGHEDLLERIARATGRRLLYAPAATRGGKVGGDYELRVPEEKAEKAYSFLLDACGLRERRFEPFTLVVPKDALLAEFRLTGLRTPLRFNRVPAAWRAEADLEGSLDEQTVAGLLAAAAAGEPLAARVLGWCGPRTGAALDGLVALLEGTAPEVREAAAGALAAFGHAARPALDRLREVAGKGGGEALNQALRTIERARHPGLLDPSRATEVAPALYRVVLETSRGEVEIEVRREWAPRAADRFYNLVRIGFLDGARFFRVIGDFVAQFGLSADPEVNKVWYGATLRDEPVRESNVKGTIAFARTDEPDTRSTQVFVNLGDNKSLDGLGFAPFGVVTRGMDVAEGLYAGYGERPDQGRIHFGGEAYLAEEFPRLDVIRKARIVE